jgi:hypothetical protein
MLKSSSPRNRTLSNGFEDRRANPSHSQAITIQCPCQESNLIFDLRRVACASTTLHRHFLPSGAGGIRTHKHLFLRQVAQPLAYHTLLRETLLRFELKATCFADMSRTKRSSAVPISSPGRTRTVDRLGVNQVPSPLGHRTICFKQSGRPGTRTPKRD